LANPVHNGISKYTRSGARRTRERGVTRPAGTGGGTAIAGTTGGGGATTGGGGTVTGGTATAAAAESYLEECSSR